MSLKNHELDINVAKNGQFRFSAASSKFCGKWQIPWCSMKINMPHNTAGPDMSFVVSQE